MLLAYLQVAAMVVAVFGVIGGIAGAAYSMIAPDWCRLAASTACALVSILAVCVFASGT